MSNTDQKEGDKVLKRMLKTKPKPKDKKDAPAKKPARQKKGANPS